MGYVLRILTKRLPRRTPYSRQVIVGTWFGIVIRRHGKSMKSLTSGLARLGAVRLLGWGPRDPPKQWFSAAATGVLSVGTFLLLHNSSIYYFAVDLHHSPFVCLCLSR